MRENEREWIYEVTTDDLTLPGYCSLRPWRVTARSPDEAAFKLWMGRYLPNPLPKEFDGRPILRFGPVRQRSPYEMRDYLLKHLPEAKRQAEALSET